MATTNKDVMEESAQVLADKITIPDGPNVAPSPGEHLAAQGIVQPPARAGHSPGASDAADDPAGGGGLPGTRSEP